MARPVRHSPDGSGASVVQAVFNAYSTRIMLALVASLVLVLLCLHLPLEKPLRAVGWRFARDFNEPMVSVLEVKEKAAQAEGEGVPITTFEAPEEQPADEGEDEASGEEESKSETLPTPAPRPIEKMQTRPILEFAEKPPDIVGGRGAYYIHIEYPPEAIAKGIEGQLILAFVVEPDGQPSDIQVLRSLHPLCDSSAVRALRKTRFIPGRQNGEVVRVRMRLPVRFRLVNPNSADSSATQTTSSGVSSGIIPL